MRKRGLPVTLTVLCLLFFANSAAADNDGPERFHEVKSWRGRFVATARGDGTQQPLADMIARVPGIKVLTYDGSVSVDFLLDEFEDEPALWRGRVLNSNLTASYRGLVEGEGSEGRSRKELTFSTSGPLEFDADDRAKLAFHRERGWSFHVGGGWRNAEHTEITTIWHKGKEMFNDRRDWQARAYGLRDTATLPYPEKGLVLTATGETELQGVGSSSANVPLIWDYKVYLEPAEMEELRLEIELPADYNSWRPKTTPERSPGKPLEVTARVVTAKGGQPIGYVKSFTWELQNTSKEPGVTMNFPLNASDTLFDLELDAGGEYFELSREKQQMDRAVREGWSDTVKIVPFDWGGWSTLQVTAEMVNGRQLMGKVKGKSDYGLRVPKRTPDSHIADSWKDRNKSGRDDLDDDNEPMGDGTKGDGLTLYEEYRGFYVAGKRVECSPKTKDYFVDISRAGFALPGVERFRRDTRLAVHPGLSETDLPQSRVINANHKLGAHKVDQHAILVRVGSETNFSLTVGGPGNPKMISAVDLIANAGSDAVSASARKTHSIDSIVAHELGHTVNIWHHGEFDPGFVRWTVKNGSLYEGAEKIEVQNPAGVVVTDDIIAIVNGRKRGYLQGWRAAPAEESGQHSGSDTCIMRYWCAQTFEIMPGWRMTDFDEPIGDFLCSSPQGTGINDSNNGGLHGNAAKSRGACSKQILVTDAADAPTRILVTDDADAPKR